MSLPLEVSLSNTTPRFLLSFFLCVLSSFFKHLLLFKPAASSVDLVSASDSLSESSRLFRNSFRFALTSSFCSKISLKLSALSSLYKNACVICIPTQQHIRAISSYYGCDFRFSRNSTNVFTPQLSTIQKSIQQKITTTMQKFKLLKSCDFSFYNTK